MTLTIAVAGCGGRMGQMLCDVIRATPACTLAAGSEREISDALRQKMQGVEVTSSIPRLFELADAVIDFTTPDYTLALAQAAAEAGKIHIIGTTGFEPEQTKKLHSFTNKSRTVWSANMSLGVNILERLVQQTAALLGEEFDIEIVEMHHRLKKDAPSGTALMLGEAAARGRGVKLADKRVSTRDGITGERRRGDIGFATLRGGDVVGDHTVMFAGPAEVIELTHKGFSREIYARGAVRAALWAQSQPAGLYTMQDVLFGSAQK